MKKAISLKYEKGKDAPEVTYKGYGIVAEKMIEIASKYGIPVYEDKVLTELLDQVPVGEEIPEELYVAVAEVFAFTYNLLREEIR